MSAVWFVGAKQLFADAYVKVVCARVARQTDTSAVSHWQAIVSVSGHIFWQPMQADVWMVFDDDDGIHWISTISKCVAGAS